jgi:hypothetical protein
MNFAQLKAEVEKAPTVPLVDDTRVLISNLLSASELEDSDLFEFADLLFGLMSKLADVYAYVDDNQSALIVDWIRKHWRGNDLEYIDLLVTILTNLSPAISKPFFDEKIKSCCDKEVKEILLEGIRELNN